MMAITLSWIYCLRSKQPPERRYSIKGRDHFSFSGIRYSIAKVISQKEFSGFLNKIRKPKENNLIAAFLKLAA